MKMSGTFAAFALVAAAGSALAGPAAPVHQQPAPAGPTAALAPLTGRIEPISVERVRYVNGRSVPIGPEIPYHPAHGSRTNPQYAWDAYESGVGAASVPGGVPDGNRYLYQWTAGA